MVDSLLLLCQIKIYQLLRSVDPSTVFNAGKLLDDYFEMCVDSRLARVSGANFRHVYLYAWHKKSSSPGPSKRRAIEYELQIGHEGDYDGFNYDARSPRFPYRFHVYGGLSTLQKINEEWEVQVWYRHNARRKLEFMIDDGRPNWQELLMNGWQPLRLDQDDFKQITSEVTLTVELPPLPESSSSDDSGERRAKRRRSPTSEDTIIHIDD
jgi:hypothetical protein